MRLYFLALLFSVGILATAQTKTYLGLKIGGGTSSAFMRHSVFNIQTDIKFLSGFHGGIHLTHFPEKLKSKVNTGIQIGVTYIQKGWKQRFRDTNEPNHTTRINYLEIPIDGIIYFGNRNKYYVGVGFFFEYAISANVDRTPDSAEPNPDLTIKTLLVGESIFFKYRLSKDNRISYGPRGTIGVIRETDLGSFRFQVFYSFSLRSVFDFEPIETGIPDLALNFGVGASISYMFSFGKLEI